jgi:Uma2 family endonuclease
MVRRLDVSFFFLRPDRTVPRDSKPIPFPPDIAVEVLSPSESAIEVNRRVRDYLKAGTKEVWVMDHQNREVFISTEEGIRMLRAGEAIESPLLAGFRLPLDDLFSEIAGL